MKKDNYIYFPFPWYISEEPALEWIRANCTDYRLRVTGLSSKVRGVSVTPEDAIVLILATGLKPA